MPLERRPRGERGLERRERGSARGPHAFEKQEERLAAAIPGGKQTPGSGCSRRAAHKSDVVGTLFRGEAKVTGHDASIRVLRDDLHKIQAEAFPLMVPVFTFGWEEKYEALSGKKIPAEDWIAFQMHDAALMMRIVDALRRGDVAEAKRLAENMR